MSFSINGRGKTKEDVKAALAAAFDADVLPHQPSHKHDKAAALAVAETYLNLIEPKPGHDLVVSLSGTLGWQDLEEDGKTPKCFTTSGVSVSVYQVNAPA